MAAFLEAIADASPGGVVIHCGVGKDLSPGPPEVAGTGS
ncbi:MAG: tyrosine-protein phosphatase [bacterium]|jgi:hypothetical protein|nr:tyrosine-protein phosphatase [bacterium]